MTTEPAYERTVTFNLTPSEAQIVRRALARWQARQEAGTPAEHLTDALWTRLSMAMANDAGIRAHVDRIFDPKEA